jgi:hypothetical protein
VAKSYVALKSWNEAIETCDLALRLGMGVEGDFEAMLVMGEAHVREREKETHTHTCIYVHVRILDRSVFITASNVEAKR